MTPLRRIAVIGNSLPRRCGIATFTTDLQQAISTSRPNLETTIVAMTDHGQAYDYPATVAFQIKDDNIEEYLRAADFLNAGRFDIALRASLTGEQTVLTERFGGQRAPVSASCSVTPLTPSLPDAPRTVLSAMRDEAARNGSASRAVGTRISALAAMSGSVRPFASMIASKLSPEPVNQSATSQAPSP